MNERIVYTPILKGKINDLKALGKMPRWLVALTLPIVELVAPTDKTKFDGAILRYADQIRKHSPLHAIAVDLHAIEPDRKIGDGTPAFEATFAHLRNGGVRFIPVHGFDREPELWDRVAPIARLDGRGIAFRLEVEDLESPDDTIGEVVDLLRTADIPASSANLIVDLRFLGALTSAEQTRLRDRLQELIDVALTARDFRLISVVGSSMPNDVSGVPREGMAAITRKELPLWLAVRTGFRDSSIAFGDYGIVHPSFSDKNPATNANAKIRYTTREHCWIFRGYRLRDGIGYRQYHDLSARVIAHPEYLGPDYSFGDDYLLKCAHRVVSYGNLGTWVAVDMNHHLVYVSAQLWRVAERLAEGVPIEDVLAVAG